MSWSIDLIKENSKTSLLVIIVIVLLTIFLFFCYSVAVFPYGFIFHMVYFTK